jgi:hypothetical protein
MTSAERVRAALRRHESDRIPIDFGSTNVTGLHVTCIAALRRYFELGDEPVKVIEPGQMLGEVGDDLKRILGVDTEGVARRTSRYGFALDDWKPYRLYDGLEVLVPGGFNVTIDANGDTLMHPGGDVTLPAGARMPKDGYFFDSIVRQQPIDEDKLDPADNLEEYQPISDAELDHLERESVRAAATGRAVVASFGGASFGDISHIPGSGLANPKGIRDITEWYVSLKTRRDYVHKVFEGQCEIALANLERIAARVGDRVDVINICGTDFGTQNSSFCSVATFEDLWAPYYRRINRWVHHHTNWRTFKHCCGAVEKFIEPFLECGFDILNPVQCSAAGMDPETLKEKYGERLVFWGGGVDTQQALPFGTPEEVREQVLQRCEIFSRNGGFVFNTIHNIQARTPVENILAMVDAVREFNGEFR